MVEVLQQRPGQHVWQLLLPGLAQAMRTQAGSCGAGECPLRAVRPQLGGARAAGERLLCVQADKPAARLWAAEQALRCADVAAVLAWLPQAKSAELRRLHMAAQQHVRLLFVFRGLNARHDASPAPLAAAARRRGPARAAHPQAARARRWKRRWHCRLIPRGWRPCCKPQKARLAADIGSRAGDAIAPGDRMYWIALLPSHEDERCAWGWRALQFTPRVAQVDEALLLEASASLRLWGGRKRLLRRLFHECEPLAGAQWAQGATSFTALGLLRLKLRGETAPARLPQDLPLEVLSAAREHVATLERIGCRNWGDLRALPRAGVARRFGAGLLDALDAAYGERPERYPWLQLPEEFDLKLELACAGHHGARTDVERPAPARRTCRSGCRRAIAACWHSNSNGRWTCGA